MIWWTGLALDDAPAPPADGEAYLRLAALDLEDFDAIEAWIRTYGPMEMGPISAGRPWRGITLHHGGDVIAERLSETASAASDLEWPSGWALAETLVAFRWGAACIKDLVTAWRVVAGELSLERAEWVAPIWDLPRRKLESYPWEDHVAENGFRQDGPAFLLATYLSDGLEPFSPRILAGYEDPVRPLRSADTSRYDVYCLELYNHIVTQTGYRTCASETCGRLYTRQHGRAKFGQHHTTGVLYCSADCARAQAQRQYRRRKSKARQQVLRPVEVKRNTSNTVLISKPEIVLPAASDWLRKVDPSDTVHAQWDLTWSGQRLDEIRLVVRDRRHQLVVELNPEDRDHIAAVYNGAAPGTIAIRAQDDEFTQLAANMQQAEASRIALRYPGLAPLSHPLEAAWLRGPKEIDGIEDEVMRARVKEAIAWAQTPDVPANVREALLSVLHPAFAAFATGQTPPPATVDDPAILELERASLVGLPLLAETATSAMPFHAAPRPPGPPPSPARLRALVQQAKELMPRFSRPIAIGFGERDTPESVLLRDGTAWPLLAAWAMVMPIVEADHELGLVIMPAGRLVDDEILPFLTCSLAITDDTVDASEIITISDEGLRLPSRLMARPLDHDCVALSDDDLRQEMHAYWVALLPGILERVIPALADALSAS